MIRYVNVSRTWRRLHLHGGLWTDLNVPYVSVFGEGRDDAAITVGYGTYGNDPVLALSLDLTGTRAGRLVAWLCWRKRVVAEKYGRNR